MSPVRRVACPACAREAAFDASNPWRPFCSERCRITDLGAWATERYRIPARPAAEEGEAESGPDAGPQTGHA